MDHPDEKRLFSRTPLLLRELVVAVAVLLTVLVPVPGEIGDRTSLGYVFAVAPVAILPLRHRFPIPVLVACVLLECAAAITFVISPFTTLACVIAVYTVAAHTRRRTAVIAALGSTFPMLTANVIAVGVGNDPMGLPIAVQFAFAAALGQAVRVRRAYIAEMTDRVYRAEATREAEASRRVAEDRLRIARDLHDAVAHQITVISLNAGVASSAITTRPEVAADALVKVRESARLVLREIGDLMATLRSPDEALDSARGLGNLAELLAHFSASGLEVRSEISGDPSRVSSAVDIIAYRVLQESLTNALRHGTGATDVKVSMEDHELRIRVSNRVGTRAGLGSGHGLVGIEERVASVRGQVSHGIEDGIFVVEARLPANVTGENVTGAGA